MTPNKFLKHIRESRGWTQKDVARHMEVSVPYVKKVEQGFLMVPMAFFKKLRPHLSKSEQNQAFRSMVESLKIEWEREEQNGKTETDQLVVLGDHEKHESA